MKINERTLVLAANSSQLPIDRMGWLSKRGETNRTFQRRWCVLKANLFYYFERQTDREPIGVIILEGCRIELADYETETFAFKIEFGGEGSRTYTFACSQQQDMELWMKALSCASYDYLKMLVSEMRRQLDDINEAELRRKALSDRSQPQSRQSVRLNPFDSETSDLIDLQEKRASAAQQSQNTFTRRAFSEIHEHYGLKFRPYLEEQRTKHEINLI